MLCLSEPNWYLPIRPVLKIILALKQNKPENNDLLKKYWFYYLPTWCFERIKLFAHKKVITFNFG